MIQLLIDGHNLIGQAPGLSLTDFDDEQQLVALLRKYVAQHLRKKGSGKTVRVVVVFDSGIPGGRSQALSGGGVETVFAADKHTTADRVLIERIRNTKRPREWMLVSSDRSIQQEADRYRMPTIEAADFARALIPPQTSKSTAQPVESEKPEREDNIAEWIRIFRKQ